MSLTAGPWKAARVYGNNVPDSFKVFTKPFGGVCVADCGDNEENANLVSAAPEMYAALKILLQKCSTLDRSVTHRGLSNCEAIAKACAAVSKAEGEQT